MNYRQRLEDLCKKEFAAAMRALADEEARLAQMKEACSRSCAEIDRLKENGADLDEIKRHFDYLKGLKARIEKEEKVVKDFRARLESKRIELSEASKNKKIIDIMREHASEIHSSRAEKEEQKAMDDLASLRFKKGAEA